MLQHVYCRSAVPGLMLRSRQQPDSRSLFHTQQQATDMLPATCLMPHDLGHGSGCVWSVARFSTKMHR